MAKDDALMSKNMMNICFFVEQLTFNFLGDGDPGVFHIVECSFDSGSKGLKTDPRLVCDHNPTEKIFPFSF